MSSSSRRRPSGRAACGRPRDAALLARAARAEARARRRPRPRSTRSAGRPAARGQARVLREHPVLAVDGHEVRGPHALQQLDEVVLAAVAGDVDARDVPRMHDVAAAAVEVADHARDRALVAGDRRARRARRCRPGPTASVAVLVDADQRQRRHGSPWLPDDEERADARRGSRPGRRRAARAPAGDAQEPQVAWPRPRCPPCAGRRRRRSARARRARSATRCMRGIEVAKHETRTRPRVRANTSSNAGTMSSSPPVRPRCSTFVLSESSTQHAAVAPGGERLEVGALLGRGVGVDLEVAAREHHARRRLDGEREAVEHAVGHADGMDAEGPDLDRLAGREQAQVRRHAALAQPPSHEAEGEPAAVDRRRRRLQRERRARRCGPRGRGSAGCREGRSRRSARYWKSGTMESMPGIRRRGRCTPASTSSRWSSHSSTIAFRPNSPSPPRGMRRSGRSSIGSSQPLMFRRAVARPFRG